MARVRNLQPWLDYFKMLGAYESKGLLEIQYDRHEAYLTVAAACTLTELDVSTGVVSLRRLRQVVTRLLAYAGWKSLEGKGYMDRPFAVHVVKDDTPHDLLYTMLLMRRRWWNPWRWIAGSSYVKFIYYDLKKKK